MTIPTRRLAQMSTIYPKSNIFMAAKDSPVAPWKRALNYFVVVVAVVAVVGFHFPWQASHSTSIS